MSKTAKFSWGKVRVGAPNECWNWHGSLNSHGYGDCVQDGRRSNASRAAYIDVHGAVPAGTVICHSCDNRRCCNPRHLWKGTQADNLKDCRDKGRQTYLVGEAHPRATAKLSEADISLAKRMHSDGLSQVQIGLELGVHSSTISRALRGKTWGHIQ